MDELKVQDLYGSAKFAEAHNDVDLRFRYAQARLAFTC